MFPRFLWIVTISALFISCNKDEMYSTSKDDILTFSTDTLLFDTVFTTIGSTTKSFRFYNPTDKTIKTTINLAGGESSSYRLNIDGIKATSLRDYEIRGRDSIYIFVEVTVDPQNNNSPVVIEDSIIFFTNGNQQGVKLRAYGQDVHLINGDVVKSQTWDNDKPYLIYNSVYVDSGEILTINAGCQLYFHKNSSMVVWGTIKTNGTKDEPVIFQGDRLEDDYVNIPGQWGQLLENNGNPVQLGGIHLLQSSVNNEINYTEVRNSVTGIELWDLDSNSPFDKLVLSNSKISNMAHYGLCAKTSTVKVINTIISQCGYHSACLLYGGKYQFYHSTIVNYLNDYFETRESSALVLKNYYYSNDGISVFNMEVEFENCIIVGDVENELFVDEFPNSDNNLDFFFDHCLFQLSPDYNVSNEDNFNRIIKIEYPNSAPYFVDTANCNYRLDSLSIAINKGSVEYGRMFPFDADGTSRIKDNLPDLGAFERIE